MWNLRLFGEVTIFDSKMPTAPDFRKRMKLWHFLKVLQNSWNLQNLLESPSETCKWNLRLFREVTIFDRKMPTATDLRKRMKLWHFLKVLQNSWNLQNLLESPTREHASEIWGSLEKLQFLTVKCLQRRTLEKRWNYDIFSKFSKIHETYRIYWNHLQEHASEIWGSLEKLQFLTEKCRQRLTLKKDDEFSHSWNLQNLLESLPETCMWNLRLFGEVTIFDSKMPTAPDLRKKMKLWHFLKVLQNSWNLQNLLESPPETCMWNLRQFGEVTIFDRKMPTATDLRKRMKLWHFLKVLQNSWNLQNLLESPPRTCIWNLRQFGEVTIFDRKMPTAPDLIKRMKLWHFLKVLQNS